MYIQGVGDLKKGSRGTKNRQSTDTRQPEDIIIRKALVHNWFRSSLWFGLEIFALYTIFNGPFSLNLMLITLPFQMVFIFFGYFGIRNPHHVIAANADGLLIEDISSEPISWERILCIHMSTHYANSPGCPLSLSLYGEDELLKRMLFSKLRKRLSTRSLTVCNLFDYKVDHNDFFERLKEMHDYYTRKVGGRPQNPRKNPVSR